VLWNPRINQIAASLSDNSIHVMYDPTVSIRGAMLSASKGTKARKADDYDYAAGYSLNFLIFQNDFESTKHGRIL
jgi:hypothetical protein